MAAIQLRKATKRFGSAVVLRSIDLDVPPGKFTVLLGPSGCGKSTLLRMIAGLEDVSSGDIAIDDQVVNDLGPKERGAAMVFQNYALYPHKTVFENIAFPLRMEGIRSPDIDQRVRETARQLHIEELLQRYPRDLSGGQRQRVAMGRAIIRKPKFFLFDEPLSNLDAELRVTLRLEIARLQRQLAATMIFVTHDQVEAMTLADTLVVMHSGVIQQIGSPLEVYRAPANRFVAGFVGSPAMNFFEVISHAVVEGGTQLTLKGGVSLRIPNRLPDQPATVGIRPEHVELDPIHADNLIVAAPGDFQMVGVEHLGDRSFTHVELALGEFTFVTSAGHSIGENEQIRVRFPPESLHVFGKDGRSIASAARFSNSP
ncbi:MAG: ABC transporter ATP-binding protein [Pseudomonadota bacterium]